MRRDRRKGLWFRAKPNSTDTEKLLAFARDLSVKQQTTLICFLAKELEKTLENIENSYQKAIKEYES